MKKMILVLMLLVSVQAPSEEKERILDFGVGDGTNCVLTTKKVSCWGYEPWTVEYKNPKEWVMGGNHSCVIDDDGVWCAGSNQYHQLEVPYLVHPRELSAGYDHTCALDDEGLKCWGSESFGALDILKHLKEIKNIKHVVAGGFRTCVIDDEGVKCWGDQENIDLKTTKPIRQLGVARDYTCILYEDSSLECHSGYVAGAPDNYVNVKEIALGQLHLCLRENEHDGVKCWVDSNNSYDQANFPQDLKNVKHVVSGVVNSCVVDDAGLRCWGDNGFGQNIVPKEIQDLFK
jgi:alpha-tubulin suppressor-like RCC1 family protein